MARRLFHAIVLVGTSMGAACASRDAPAPPSDARGETAELEDSATTDSFGTSDTGTPPVDTGATVDTGTKADSGSVDTSMPPDTFPGIMPPPIDGG